MKKYSIKQLAIELTRRCNYNCAHCMRGNPQDLTITPEIIDTMFSQVSHIDMISLVGGESLLELDTLAYLLDAIDRYNLDIAVLSFFTNGSILDNRVMDMLSDFVSKDSGRTVSMNISEDPFHAAHQTQKALNFYQSINHNPQIQIKPTGHNDSIVFTYSGHTVAHRNELQNSGMVLSKGENTIRTHQISIHDDTIECVFQLNANGNVGLHCEDTYSVSDRLSIGNIMNDSLDNIITNHNRTCLHLCDECWNEALCYSGAYLNENTNLQDKPSTQLIMKMRMQHLKLIWGLRERAQQIYPKMHAIDLILGLPPLQNGVWDILYERLAINDLKKNQQRYSRYPSIATMIKAAPRRFIAERDRSEYREHFIRKYPEISVEEAERLSCLNSEYKLLMQTTVDDLIVALFGSNEQFLKDLAEAYKKYRKDENAQPENLDVCSLIPDTFDIKRKKQDDEEPNDE